MTCELRTELGYLNLIQSINSLAFVRCRVAHHAEFIWYKRWFHHLATASLLKLMILLKSTTAADAFATCLSQIAFAFLLIALFMRKHRMCVQCSSPLYDSFKCTNANAHSFYLFFFFFPFRSRYATIGAAVRAFTHLSITKLKLKRLRALELVFFLFQKYIFIRSDTVVVVVACCHCLCCRCRRSRMYSLNNYKYYNLFVWRTFYLITFLFRLLSARWGTAHIDYVVFIIDNSSFRFWDWAFYFIFSVSRSVCCGATGSSHCCCFSCWRSI